MQVHLDALDDFGRDAAAKLAVFGLVGWDVGLEAIGVPNASEALRELAAAEVLVEQAHARFAGTREFAFKHALMREVAYASLGEDALRECHARAGRWLAKMGEDDAIVARHLELGGEGASGASYLEKAARRRARGARAAGGGVARREGARVRRGQADAVRARAAARRGLEPPRRARRRARHGRARDGGRRSPTRRARCARAARACATRTRAAADAETSARLDEVRRAAQEAGLPDEEARCAAALAARYAYAGELDKAAEVADSLLTLSQRHNIAGAAVDAWQTLAVVRQARGEVGAALEARRSAARAASAAGLKTREATLTINVGFALTTVGARGEARLAIESGIALAQAIGSPGVERHGKMILLCWAATFGSDASLDAALAEPRGHGRRGARRQLGPARPRDARRPLLPGHGAPARAGRRERRAHAAQDRRAGLPRDEDARRAPGRARPLGGGRAPLRQRDAGARRSRARRRACSTRARRACSTRRRCSSRSTTPASISGELEQARNAIARGVPRLVTRLKGLAGTPYARAFLTQLAPNAGLLAAAEAYGLVPDEITAALATEVEATSSSPRTPDATG